MAQFRVTPTRQSRLYEDVANQLREGILSGQFVTGERLPTEAELAGQFGVSRTVVRQATLNLEHEGLVSVLVGASGGTYVRASDSLPVLRALENNFRHRGVSVEDYLQAKRLIEPSVIEEIMRFSDGSHRARLHRSIDEFAQALADGATDERLLTLSLDFHEILLEATGNPVLQILLSALVRMGERVPEFKAVHNQDWDEILAEHKAMLGALDDNDLRGFRTLMLEHLDSIQHIYADRSVAARTDRDA